MCSNEGTRLLLDRDFTRFVRRKMGQGKLRPARNKPINQLIGARGIKGSTSFAKVLDDVARTLGRLAQRVYILRKILAYQIAILAGCRSHAASARAKNNRAGFRLGF